MSHFGATAFIPFATCSAMMRHDDTYSITGRPAGDLDFDGGCGPLGVRALRFAVGFVLRRSWRKNLFHNLRLFDHDAADEGALQYVDHQPEGLLYSPGLQDSSRCGGVHGAGVCGVLEPTAMV